MAVENDSRYPEHQRNREREHGQQSSKDCERIASPRLEQYHYAAGQSRDGQQRQCNLSESHFLFPRETRRMKLTPRWLYQ